MDASPATATTAVSSPTVENSQATATTAAAPTPTTTVDSSVDSSVDLSVGQVDVIIGSDLVYEDRILALLVPTIRDMLKLGRYVHKCMY